MRGVSWCPMMLLLWGLLLATPVGAGPPELLEAQEIQTAQDAPWLGDRDVVFYAEDLETGERYVFGRKKAEERHTPWSTFKIPNLLIALESGVISGLESRIEYDPARRPAQDYWPSDWQQGQTAETAFKRSAAWYFQELAVLVGAPTYRGYLGHFGYGNLQVPEGSDSFWLDGSLQISPREQVSFLRRLLVGQLEISPRNIELLSQVSRLKSSQQSTLHGKTGAGPRRSGAFDGPFEGWLVGWVERPDHKPVVYALWAAGPSYDSLREFRQQAAERLLSRLGFWSTAP